MSAVTSASKEARDSREPRESFTPVLPSPVESCAPRRPASSVTLESVRREGKCDAGFAARAPCCQARDEVPESTSAKRPVGNLDRVKKSTRAIPVRKDNRQRQQPGKAKLMCGA